MNIKVFTRNQHAEIDVTMDDGNTLSITLDRFALLALRIKLQNAWNKLENSTERVEIES